jgi:plasmid stability protein
LIWPANSIRDEPKVAGRSEAVYLLALIADQEVITVSAVSIRNLDDQVKERLRVRAARHGRSMEAEMRAILTDAVREPGEDTGLFQVLLERVSQLGGIELDIPARVVQPRAADLS